MRATRRAVAAVASCALLLLPACVLTKNSFESANNGPELTVWSYLTQKDDQTLPRIDGLFEKKHPNVSIEHVVVPINEFGPKLLAAAGTGDGPDVIIGNPVVDFPLLSSADVYEPLDEYWRDFRGRQQFADDAQWRADDQLYAVHWRYNNLGLWYNADILAEYDLRPPRTVDELESAMRTIAADGKYRGITFSGEPSVQGTWQFMTWAFGEGVNYCNIESDRTTDVLQRLSGWVERGYTPQDVAALDPEGAFQRFLTGNYAFAQAGSWEVGLVRSDPPDFELGTARIPEGSEGSYVSFAGESVGIGAFTDQERLAWDYVRTSYLSRQGQRTMFTESGAIPTRDDVRRGPVVTRDRLSAPFVRMLEPDSLRPWPDNQNSQDAQIAVGTVYSSVLSGDTEPAEAQQQMTDRVESVFAEGGGSC